jgi:hypothetical protein
VRAIHIQYRGPMIGDDGELPLSGMVTFCQIDTNDYQEEE